MTENITQILLSNPKGDQSYCTRNSDGVSRMTVTVLAKFCGGTKQQTATQLLNRLRDSDPITNELVEYLKSLAGKDWRFITNDLSVAVFIIDEVCHAVLEYYALEACKYKGKQTAINNYRMIARAGFRVFIWSQTGYSLTRAITTGAMSFEDLSSTITVALEQALAPINQRLEQIEQHLSALPKALPTPQADIASIDPISRSAVRLRTA